MGGGRGGRRGAREPFGAELIDIWYGSPTSIFAPTSLLLLLLLLLLSLSLPLSLCKCLTCLSLSLSLSCLCVCVCVGEVDLRVKKKKYIYTGTETRSGLQPKVCRMFTVQLFPEEEKAFLTGNSLYYVHTHLTHLFCLFF